MAKGFQVIDGGRGAGCGFLTEADIEAYFSGTLTAERGAMFSAHQAAGCGPCSMFDADMQAFRKVLTDGALESERRDFEASAAAQRDALRSELGRSAGPPRRRIVPNWLLSAAALIAIVGIVSFQFLRSPELVHSVMLPDGESFAFQAPAPPPLVRDGGDFARGRAAFAAREWSTAAAAFESVEAEDPRSADAEFYAGVSHLLNHEIPLAVERLTEARERAMTDGVSGEATYYLALAQIGAGNPVVARELLESIQDGPGAVEAGRLLDLLSP